MGHLDSCLTDVVDHNKLWKILKEMGIRDHLTSCLRSLQVKRKQLELDMKQQAVYCHPEYIMRNAGLEEAQAGIKIAGRNINNLRYAEDTTLRWKVKDQRAS